MQFFRSHPVSFNSRDMQFFSIKMPVTYFTEHDTKSHRVKIENNGLVKVQKFINIYDDENNILSTKPLKIFLGKCDVINMLMKLGNLDKSLFSRNTILLKISEENKKNLICVCWRKQNIFFHN